MPLSLLDEKVRSRLRSGVAITSMAQCAGELVENAIDAGAKCIAVRVDVSKYKIQVIDNGSGVTRKDLDLIGQRYATSKCHTIADLDHSLQHLGYRGEALASTINCSGTVEILSRHRLSQETYSKIFLHGEAVPITSSTNQRPSVGTTVTVHDFFYNLPVRRRLIAEDLELENIRQVLVSITLANPSISFSLRNDLIGECVLQTRRTNSVLASFSILFGSSKASSMKEVSLEHAVFNITGYLSTDSHHSKYLQFVYVNGRLVKKTPLHSCVNNLIANSLIGRCLSKQADSRWRGVEADITSPKRVSDRHAVYVLMIRCSLAEYDICLEPAKTLIEFKDWDVILYCLTQVVRQFLVKHSLTLGPECVEREDTANGSPEEHCDREVSTPRGGGDMCIDPVSASRGLDQNIGTELEQSITNGETGANPIQQEKPCSILNRPRSTPGVSVDHQRSTAEKPEAVGVMRKSGPGLHLDRPVRSPFNSRSTTSKLAGFLRSEKSKLSVLHNAMSVSRQVVPHNTLPTSIGCRQDVHVVLNTVPASIGCEIPGLQNTMPAIMGCARPGLVPASMSCERPNTVPVSTACERPGLLNNMPTVPCAKPGLVPVSMSCERPGVQNTMPVSMACERLSLQNTMPEITGCERPGLVPSSMGCERPGLQQNTMPAIMGCERPSLQNTMPAIMGCARPGLVPASMGCGRLGEQNTMPVSIDLRPALLNRVPASMEREKSCQCVHIPGRLDLCVPQKTKPASTGCERPDLHVPKGCTREKEEESYDVNTLPFQGYSSGGHVRSAPTAAEHMTNRSLEPNAFEDHEALGHPPTAAAILPILQSHNSTLPSTLLSFDPAVCTDPAVSIPPTTAEDFALPIDDVGKSQAAVSLDTHIHGLANSLTSACFECQLSDTDPTASTCEADLDSQDEVTDGGSAVVKEVSTSVAGFQGIWKEVIDPVTAKKVYVHTKTGNSYSSVPYGHSKPNSDVGPVPREHVQAWNGSSEGGCVCHGEEVSPCYGAKPIRAAPHLSHDFQCFLPGTKRLKLGSDVGTSEGQAVTGVSDAISDAAWRDGVAIEGSCGPFESLLKNWKNPTFLPGQEGILGTGVGHRSQIKVHNIINHYKFSKEMLGNVKILGQVDKKFIACVLDTKGTGQHDLLVCFDQHAAHERVRLEALHDDLYESGSGGPSSLQPSIKSSTVHPPLLINLTTAERKLAKTFQKQLEVLGVTLVQEGGSVGVASLPSVMVEREVSEVKRGRAAVAMDMVQEMIVKHLEVLRATSGGSSALPPSLTNVLNSQACRSAIKFGDPLTTEECSDLIHSLSKCKLPFQCAHGRPSVVPILDVEILKKKYRHSQTLPSELCKKLSAKLLESQTSS